MIYSTRLVAEGAEIIAPSPGKVIKYSYGAEALNVTESVHLSKMKFQAPRGTSDVLPAESARWLAMEGAFRDTARRFCYQEMRTPTFEETGLFLRTAGETSDIVSKQMYTFEDKGGRSMTLKPEETASALRAVIQHNLCPQGQQLRLSYVTSIFRYERPQMGRYREAHQFGLELLGVTSVKGDVEIIEASVSFYRSIGLGDVVVYVNSLGRSEARARYRVALLEYAAAYLRDQELEAREKIEKNPLRLLDSKDPEVVSLMASAPSILDFLEDSSRQRFEELQQDLEEKSIAFEVRPEIVRGLDYYTETVFEIQSSHLGAQGALCGGGRYDGLIADLGGPNIPAVGVGMGIERALIVQEQIIGKAPLVGPDVYVVSMDENVIKAVANLVQDLRNQGLAVACDLDRKSSKAQMKQADQIGAKFAVIFGSQELATGKVQLKELATSHQVEIASDDIAEMVKK